MPRPVVYPNVFGQLSGTVSASLLDQNFNADGAIINDSAAGWTNAGTDTGTVNAYVVTLNPPASAYLNGFFLAFSPLNANTGPSSINVNGLGNIQILTAGGSTLAPQAIQPGTLYSMVCYNNSMRIISPSVTELVGEMRLFTGPSSLIPANYQLAGGQAVSRTSFPALFAIIGTTFGAGDGSTTFNLPNMTQRFPYYDTTVGNTGGSLTNALSVANLPPHTHSISDPSHSHGVNDPSHAHTYAGLVVGSGVATGGGLGVGSNQTNFSFTNIQLFAAFTGITGTNSTGSGTPVNNLPPYLTMNFIIRMF